MKEFKANNRSKPMEGSLKPAEHFKKHNDPEVNTLLSNMKETRKEIEGMNQRLDEVYNVEDICHLESEIEEQEKYKSDLLQLQDKMNSWKDADEEQKREICKDGAYDLELQKLQSEIFELKQESRNVKRDL